MKKLIARTFASFLLGVLTLGLSAQAQHAEAIKVNIPFEFSVGDMVFPAGSYSLVNEAPAILDLRTAEGRTLARVLTNSVETSNAPASPRLDFYSEGGRYSLAQVWQENYSIGREVPQSKAWAKVAKRQSKRIQIMAARNSQ
jgi:hypothetical protein